MLKVALLHLLLLSCWPSSHARGIYNLVPLRYAHQDVNIATQDGSPQSAPLPYSFSYNAEGADGSSSHRETGSVSGSVSGSYSLKIKDGRNRQVDYTADAGGFKAQVNTNEPGTKSENPAEVSFQSSAPQPAPIGVAVVPVGGHVTTFQSGLAGADGAPSPYSFGYMAEGTGGSSSHHESGDGSGNVKGSYSLKVKDGRNRQVDYTADAAGFKASINTNELGTKTGSSADAHFISSAPQQPEAAPSLYTGAPISGTGSLQVFQSLGAGGESAPSPYSFGYSAEGVDGGSSHQESSDGAGNVRGSYSLKVKDGRSRKVDYTADAAGFKASVNTNEPGTKSDSPADASFHSSAPQLVPAIAVSAPAVPAFGIPAPAFPVLGTGDAAVVTYRGSVGGGEGAPSPYSFGYTAQGIDGSSSHQESSDGAGNVKGSYGLKIKDGRSRQVDYTADAGGFRANVNTNEPGTKSESPAQVPFYSFAPQIPAIGTPIFPGPAAEAIPSGGAAISFHAGVPGAGGAPSPYSFGYTAQGTDGGSSRQESFDGSGRVTGTYSLNVNDGRRRKVDYTAGAEGFKASVDTNEPGTKSDSPAQASFHSSAPQITHETGVPAISSPLIPTAGAGASVISYKGILGGAEGAPSPYSFGYTAAGLDGSSSHQESSDGSGNVKGTYSLKIKDGRNRQVDYTADAAGFKANVNTNEPGTKSGDTAGAKFYSSAPQPSPIAGGPAAALAPWLSTGGVPAAAIFQIAPGGPEGAPSPYSFGYVAEGIDGSSSHHETGDGSGKVSGSYSLKIKDGRNRKVDYTADGAGFKAQVNTNEPGTKSENPAEVSFHSSAPQIAPVGGVAPVIPLVHAGGAVVSFQGGTAAGEGAQSPYSFGYSAGGIEGGLSHQESGDGSGRVSGSYSLSIKDGRRRKVDYTADAGGFRANINTNEPGTKSENPAEVSFHSSAPLTAGDPSISQPLFQSIVHGPRLLTDEEKRWMKSM